MYNIVLDQTRARARRPHELRLFDAWERSDPRSADPHHAAELRPSLRAALDSLTVQQRTVLVLRYFDDRSEAEVARLLGISVGTVKSTSSRAIAHLRDFPGLAAIFTTTDVTYPPGFEVSPQDPHGNGTVVDTTVYLTITWANTIPADPYNG